MKRVGHELEAALVRNLLDDYAIPTRINDPQIGSYSRASVAISGIQVQVPEQLVEEARSILQEHAPDATESSKDSEETWDHSLGQVGRIVTLFVLALFITWVVIQGR